MAVTVGSAHIDENGKAFGDVAGIRDRCRKCGGCSKKSKGGKNK